MDSLNKSNEQSVEGSNEASNLKPTSSPNDREAMDYNHTDEDIKSSDMARMQLEMRIDRMENQILDIIEGRVDIIDIADISQRLKELSPSNEVLTKDDLLDIKKKFVDKIEHERNKSQQQSGIISLKKRQVELEA